LVALGQFFPPATRLRSRRRPPACNRRGRLSWYVPGELGQFPLGPCGQGAPDPGLEFVQHQTLICEGLLEHGLRYVPVGF
jgi:hypothetical protein